MKKSFLKFISRTNTIFFRQQKAKCETCKLKSSSINWTKNLSLLYYLLQLMKKFGHSISPLSIHHNSLGRESVSALQLEHFMEGCCRPFFTVNFELLLLFSSVACGHAHANGSGLMPVWPAIVDAADSRQKAADVGVAGSCSTSPTLSPFGLIGPESKSTTGDVRNGKRAGDGNGGCDF